MPRCLPKLTPFFDRFLMGFCSQLRPPEPQKSSPRCSESTIFQKIAIRILHRFFIDFGANMPPFSSQKSTKILPKIDPKMPPRGAKTPQMSENGAKMKPSWHQNRCKCKVIFENLKISQIVLSLQRGLDFRGFEVSFSDVKSMVFRRFFREASPRRPKKPPRRPKTPQDPPK